MRWLTSQVVPKQTSIYVWIFEHLHYLRELYAEVDLEGAVKDYVRRFGIVHEDMADRDGATP